MNQGYQQETDISPTRRASLRKRVQVGIPKQFFKKVYKKTQVQADAQVPSQALPPGDRIEQPAAGSPLGLLAAVGIYFPPVREGSRQSSAIAAYRVKKLRRLIRDKRAAIRARKFSKTDSGGVRSAGKVLLPPESSRKCRAQLAASRARDYRGQFLGSDRPKSESLEDTTVDLHARSRVTRDSLSLPDALNFSQDSLRRELFQELQSDHPDDGLAHPAFPSRPSLGRFRLSPSEELDFTDLEELLGIADSPTRARISASFFQSSPHSITPMLAETLDPVPLHLHDLEHLPPLASNHWDLLDQLPDDQDGYSDYDCAGT